MSNATQSIGRSPPRRIRPFAALGMIPGSPIPQMSGIAKVATEHFRSSAAVVTLFEQDRPYLVGFHAADGETVRRAEVLCRFALDADDVLVVRDFEQNWEFAHLAPSLGGRPVRFGAVAPLVLPDGIRIGTLAILDRGPRDLNVGQKLVLRRLALVATGELQSLAGCKPAA